MNKATVAIIGGGFSGTVAAIRLLTSSQNGDPSLPFGSRIALIEPGRAGEGLAYRAGPDCWRLNVPAARMSAFAEWPEDFVDWARARDPQVKGGDFLPRAWYGDYLSERLEAARKRSPRWLRFERIRTRATSIAVEDGTARIALADGAAIDADRVLLALGNSPTAGPLPSVQAADDALSMHWLEDLPSYVPRVLFVGTGLTMVDAMLALQEQRPDARALAISRHGLLPMPHQERLDPKWKFDAKTLLARGPLSQRLRLFRDQVAASGDDWRSVLQRVREEFPMLWRAAPRRMRRRFLRHLRAFWDVHRHRLPEATFQRIHVLRERKRLEIAAGRILSTKRIKGGTIVAWRPRGSDKIREELVDAVVNVTGPDSDPTRSSCTLVQSLLEQGLCQPDELRLGWNTDLDGRLLDSKGDASEVLYYAGPLLRAKHWEATAVPELRVHVQRSANALAASLATPAGSYVRKLAAPLFRRARLAF
jgi:uncharacterized NAD(P)/FAD-binding protein YdhS